MTFGSLFSGIGGIDLSFERAGMECAWQCEIDPAARSILKKHFPGRPLYEDVTQLSNPAPVDVLCGGFPCQDLSVAGRRAGLAGKRSGLWHHFRRVAQELAPRLVVIENVPGLLSSHSGSDFTTVLRGLAELGYCVAWRVLDSQYDRMAQRRRRVFLVGSLGDGRAAEILFEPEGLRWDLAPGREEGEEITGALTCGIGERGYSPESAASGHDVAHTLNAKGGTDRIDGESETFLVTASLTTRPYADNDGREDLLVAHTLRAGAPNGGCGHGARAGDKDESLIPVLAHTLRAEGFDASPRGADDSTLIAVDYTNGLLGEICGTLEAGQDRGNRGHGVIAYGISSDCFDRSGEGAGGTAGERPGLGILTEQSPTLRAKRPNAVGGTMGVRRLTPRECERLQGFPDDWTRWRDDGREQKDGPRYKQIGNAVNVATAAWIGARIRTFLEH